MAHNLNINNGNASMMYVGEIPWHGLGTYLETAPETAEEAIKAASLDWKVSLKPVYCMEGPHFYEIPEKKAVVRDDLWGKPECVPFALVGNDYKPLQNIEAFRFFDKAINKGHIEYHTAGALGNGEKVWVLVKISGEFIINGVDKVEKYILLANGHDGRTSLQIRFTPVRVVCQNTLTLSLKDGKDLFKVYHAPGLHNEMQNAKFQLEGILDAYSDMGKKFTQFADFKLDNELLQKYIWTIYPNPPKRKGQTARSYEASVKKVADIRNTVAALTEKGRGNSEPKIKGTLWAAYNAVIEYLDFNTTYRDRWHRLQSIWFDEASRIKQDAFDEAVKLL